MYSEKTENLLISKYGKPKEQKGSYKDTRKTTETTPSYKKTTKYGDSYTTVEHPETSKVKEYTYKVKYKKRIWKTNSEHIECYIRTEPNGYFKYCIVIMDKKILDEMNKASSEDSRQQSEKERQEKIEKVEINKKTDQQLLDEL